MHRLTIALFAIPLLVSPLWAHHSFAAEFDAEKPVTLKGIVVKWEMMNPHGWITVDVTGTGRRESPVDGRDLESERSDEAWLDKEFAETGRSDHVEAYRAKDGSNTANAARMTLADGRNVFAGSSLNSASDAGAAPQGK